MRGAWHRSLLAFFLVTAAVPYFLGPTLPHDCSDAPDAHEGHGEEAALSGTCAFCDLALPVAESGPSFPLLAVPKHWAVMVVPQQAGVLLRPAEDAAARGPPQA